ncbi:transmembrane protein 205-like [Actinia tenebrosa]|uniref:Transmembrane protein 205-like n=1 Tax=Actinia tenebrosa TaxID=6105 RepID=A0A6P8HBK2_ACTTE|nr:transmembrane protein 205-like [Actinia tenebrosa]
MSSNQVLSSKPAQNQDSKLQKRVMTLRVCPQLTTFVVLMLALSLSSRISEEVRRGSILSTVTRFTHLFAFGTWLGIQFWATFIAGVTMYFNMGRHAFGELQSKLFPKYFFSGACLTAITLATYCLIHPIQHWEGKDKIQSLGLLVSLICCMMNYMYLEPTTTRLMDKRYAFEKERGYGQEIGPIPDNKLKNDEEYLKITKSFACVHGFSSMANLMSYAGCLLHLWYLATQVTM